MPWEAEQDELTTGFLGFFFRETRDVCSRKEPKKLKAKNFPSCEGGKKSKFAFLFDFTKDVLSSKGAKWKEKEKLRSEVEWDLITKTLSVLGILGSDLSTALCKRLRYRHDDPHQRWSLKVYDPVGNSHLNKTVVDSVVMVWACTNWAMSQSVFSDEFVNGDQDGWSD